MSEAAAAVVLAWAAAELVEWAAPAAAWIVLVAARTLGDPDAQARYTAEWLDTVESIPGLSGKLLVAVGILLHAPHLRRTLHHPYPADELAVVADSVPTSLPPAVPAGPAAPPPPTKVAAGWGTPFVIHIHVGAGGRVEIHQHASPGCAPTS